MPSPPQPPFAPAPDGDGWAVELPSAVGRTVRIGVDAEGITLSGERIACDDVDHARFKVEVGDAILRRAASARMTVEVTRADGTTVKLAARNAASARRADAIVATLHYLWGLLGDQGGARRREVLIARIGRGSEVNVGGARLTAIGLAWKRNPIVSWSDVGDPVVRDLSVVLPTDGHPIRVSMAADDAYMLPTLVPILRRAST